MLSTYLNQSAVYKAALRDEEGMAMDEYGQAQYEEEVIRPCRRQPKAQEVLTANGQAIKTTMVYYLEAEVFEGDLLDGLRVEQVGAWVTLGGTPMGWKAVC